MPTPVAITDRTFAFACEIVRLYKSLTALPGFPPRIAGQLLGAGTSIGSNVEESRAAFSRRDMASRLSVSLREARETKFWLRLIRATNLAPQPLTASLLPEADELVAILTASVRSLRAGSNYPKRERSTPPKS